MQAHIATFTLLLALGASAHPLEGNKQSFTARLRRQAPVLPASQNLTGIFDPAFAKAELQQMLAKYSQAAQFLNGVGLNQDSHPDTGYLAFNDTPITNYFAKLPSSLLAPQHLARRDNASDEPIVGLPSADYPDPHLVLLKDYVQSGGMDTSYYGPVQVGTPAQSLTVSIDTGSADLWVPSSCASCQGGQFDASASSTFHDMGGRTTVSYGLGRVTGTLAQDTVSLASLTVANQGFVAVHAESHDFRGLPADGLIGMAFGSIAVSKMPTFFENLLSEHKLSAAIFSLHLARGEEDGSALCVGCYDLTRTTGPVRWIPLVSRTYWAVAVSGMSTDPVNSLPTDLVGAVDSGASLMYVPSDVAAQFYAMIPGAKDATAEAGDGFYMFPCSTPVQPSLSMGGHSFTIHNDDFNLGRLSADSDQCIGAILGQSDPSFAPNFAVIGDIFLKSWYSTYDYAGSRVGLAPSVNNK